MRKLVQQNHNTSLFLIARAQLVSLVATVNGGDTLVCSVVAIEMER